MKNICAICLVVLSLFLIGGIAIMTGCETAEGLQGLSIEPSYVTLTATSNRVEFSVGGATNNIMALPLEWRVTESSLGYIGPTTGWRALYVRTDVNGDNTVIVRDQYGNEGYATVKQVWSYSDFVLKATQSDTNTWTVTIETPTSAPYEWWVHYPELGTIASAGNGASAVYEAADTSIKNTVFVRDSSGKMGSVDIP